jgi:hypothetical protein
MQQNSLQMHIIVFIIVSSCLSISLLNAQEKSFRKHEFQFTLGANSHQAIEIEPNYSLMFNRYTGFSAGLNIMTQMFDNTHYHSHNANLWVISEDTGKAFTFLLRPALRLRFPVVRENGENIIYFNMEPGAFINLIPNSTLWFDLVERNNQASWYRPLASKKSRTKEGKCFFIT